MAHPKRSLHIILDFDGTLTHKDTTAVIGSIASITGSRTSPSWDTISKAYLSDYSAHETAYTPKLDARTTLSDEAAWLRSLRPIELRSVRRVEEAGLFRGVTTGTVATLATESINSGKVKLRNGWRDLLRVPSAVPSSKLSILSVNWSRTFIRQILLAAAQRDVGYRAVELESQIDNIAIYANDIEGLTNLEGSDGKLGSGGGIRTSYDKLECFQTMITGQSRERDSEAPGRLEDNGRTTERPLTVYVGDSISDLECLVAADVGICVRDEEMGSGQKELSSCLERLGIQAQPIDEAATDTILSGPKLWWTQGLGSIANVLSKL